MKLIVCRLLWGEDGTQDGLVFSPYSPQVSAYILNGSQPGDHGVSFCQRRDDVLWCPTQRRRSVHS